MSTVEIAVWAGVGLLVLQLSGCDEGPETLFDVTRRVGVARVASDGATLALDLHDPDDVVVSVLAEGDTMWVDYATSTPGALHHEIELGPLTPATRYTYRLTIGAGSFETDDLGATFGFRTPGAGAPHAPSCALLVADTQGGEYFEALGELESMRTDFAFVLSMGDQVAVEDVPTPSAREDYYLDYLLGPLSILSAHAPLMTVVGNHDAANASLMMSRDEALDLYQRHLVLPDDGPSASLSETVYSFEYEAFHVAVLDSTGPLAMRAAGLVSEEQLEWLAANMASVDGRWKVVALHHMVHGWETLDTPPLADWFHVTNYERVHQAFVDAGVDLVLSGHRHSYNVFVLDGVRYVTVPTLSRDKVLFGLYGAPSWQNLGGEEGTLDRAISDVFGFATLCGDDAELTLDVTLFDAETDGLAPVTTPALSFSR